MARIIISNVTEWHSEALKKVNEQSFNVNESICINGLFVSTCNKKTVPIENFMTFDNGDLVATTGTVLTSQFGKNTLKDIYHHFDGNIDRLRDQLIGNYAVLIKKNDKCYLFTDKYHTISLYYYFQKGGFIMSNALDLVASAAPELSVNEFALIEESFLISTCAEKTIFSEVSRLLGHEYITFDGSEFEVCNIAYSRKPCSIKDDINDYASEFVNEFQRITDRVVSATEGEIGIHMTGGLDNRTVLGAFLNSKASIKMLHGIGNDVITNTRDEDLRIVMEYAKKFDLEFDRLNWHHNYLNDTKSDFLDLFKKYGFNYTLYGPNKLFFSNYERKLLDSVGLYEFGYFGENLRLREWATDRKSLTFTLDEYLDSYEIPSCLNEDTLSDYIGFRSFVKENLEKQLRVYGLYQSNGLYHIQVMDEIRFIRARKCDGKSLNFINDYAPSIAILSQSTLHEYPFDIPYQLRAHAKFQLKVIEVLKKELLDVDFFTHGAFHQFSKKSMQLRKNFSLNKETLRLLSVFGLKPRSIKKFLKRSGIHNSSKDQQKEGIFELLGSILEGTKQKGGFNRENFHGDVRLLMLYTQLIVGAESLVDKSS